VVATAAGESRQYSSAGGDSGKPLTAPSSPPPARRHALPLPLLPLPLPSTALRSGVGEPHAAHDIGIEPFAPTPAANKPVRDDELCMASLVPGVLTASGDKGVRTPLCPATGARGPRNW
jgi:hypothetical protein